MRRTLLFILILSAFQGTSQVVATTSFLADIAKNIAGDKVNVVSLLPLGADPHIYEPVPGDVRILANASVVIRNGLHLEGWLDKVLTNSGTNGFIITASDGVVPISASGFSNSYDPHAWMSLKNGKIYAKNIARGLQWKYPKWANYFEKNLSQYLQSIDSLDRWVQVQINSLPEQQRVLFTSHDAFRYFSRDYHFNVESVLGTSTDAEVRIADLDRMIAQIDQTGVAAIFVESTINPKLMNQIATDAGVAIGGNLFADSLGPKDSHASTYLGMIQYDVSTIINGLKTPKNWAKKNAPFLGFLGILFLFLMASWWYLWRKIGSSIPDLNQKIFQININNISVTYDQVPVFSHLQVSLTSGKMHGIVGPNGSGKSTLVKAILGLQPLESGNILFNNTPLKELNGQIAYVPQKDEVDLSFPATAMDVVTMGTYRRKHISMDSIQIQMEKLGIWEWRHRPIGQLSGGQQQRCFVARALIQNAPILILDEPFVGIDASTEAKIIEVLRAEAQKGKLIIIIHHDLSKVREYFDEVLMMNRRLVAYGPVDTVFVPEQIEKTFSAPGLHFHQAQQLMKS
jgi:ABC-type Zn uptake system ZnuABC Zn-binding protein ZnuA/ABC-type Mn2+/Zn2+ transport system ATPase subunit